MEIEKLVKVRPYKTGDRAYRARVSRQLDPNRPSEYGATEAEAWAKGLELAGKLAKGGIKPDHRETVGEWLDFFVEKIVPRLPIKQKSKDEYERYVRLYLKPALGHILLARLSADDIYELLDDMVDAGKGHDCRRYCKVTLSKALNEAMARDKLVRNVAALVKLPPKESGRPTVLTGVEQDRVLAAARTERLSALFTVALHCGMRPSELQRLMWVDVHDTHIVIWTGKSRQAQRVLPLHPETKEGLDAHWVRQAKEKLAAGPAYRDNGLVFPNEIGAMYASISHFQTVWERVAERAGLKRIRYQSGIYILRRTYATVVAQSGVDPLTLKELMGHADIAVTEKAYINIPSARILEAGKLYRGRFGGVPPGVPDAQ